MKQKRKLHEQSQKARLIYSLNDLQLALSAIAFLGECDTDEKYNYIQLRRFKCYETTAIISYCRPFTKSRGCVALELSQIGNFTNDEKKLHEEILKLRNKVYAHSDEEHMRMYAGSVPVKEFDTKFPDLKFDEGLRMLNDTLLEFEALAIKVAECLSYKILKEVQKSPEEIIKINADKA